VYGKIAFQIVSRETGRWGWKAREGIFETITRYLYSWWSFRSEGRGGEVIFLGSIAD